jgi:hypothetical protein
MTKRYEAGNQTVYMYTFHAMAPVFQTCSSFAEAASWAEVYENSTAHTGGLKWWGERR